MLSCKSNFEILFKVLNFLRLYSESIFILPRLPFKATVFCSLKKAAFHHHALPSLTKAPQLQAYPEINFLSSENVLTIQFIIELFWKSHC